MSSSNCFSRGMSDGLVFPSLSEFSTVYCDPHSQVLRTHFKTILSWLLCGVTCRSSFFFSFCMWLSSFLTLYWRKCTFLTALLYRITSGLCILLNWSMSLLLCQYHTILVTLALKCVEKEKATHSSILAWRIPGTGEPGGLPSMGLHRVGHDWSDLAAAAAAVALKCSLKSGELMPPALFLFLYISLVIWSLLCLIQILG